MIVGESGSGKSILVRSIMNLLPKNAVVPPGVRVLFDGRDVHKLSKIGVHATSGAPRWRWSSRTR